MLEPYKPEAQAKDTGPPRILTSLGGMWGGLSKIIEHFALHPLDFGAVPSRDERQFLGTAALAEACQQVKEVRNALLRNFQLIVVLNHAPSLHCRGHRALARSHALRGNGLFAKLRFARRHVARHAASRLAKQELRNHGVPTQSVGTSGGKEPR